MLRNENVEHAIEELWMYANELRDKGEKGDTEADGNADYVLALIQRLADDFDLQDVVDELT